MIELVIAADDLVAIEHTLIGTRSEGCVILFANATTRTDGTTRLLVHDLLFPSADDYARRGEFNAELNPQLVARASKRAHHERLSLVFVHSHPGDSLPLFSIIDDHGEEHLSTFLSHRVPHMPHAALVVSAGGMRARRLGAKEHARVVSIGSDRRVVFEPDSNTSNSSEMFDRQVRAFGDAGQRALGKLRIGIVGLGGIGALVVQELVHLGVRDFILVDPDVVELTNLNRLSNATPNDVGSPKVEIARRYVLSVAPESRVLDLQEDVIRVLTARKLVEADLIVCCTDSHGSRAVLQQIAYQYLIPCIDIGTIIAVKDEIVTHINGRVQLLAPGFACLTCGGLLDSNQVRGDMMTAFERQADPYLSGARVAAPAVMSLNGTVASLAVTMLLSMVAGVPSKARYLVYNAVASSLRPARGEPEADCYVCSRSGAFARGDSWPIFGRQD